MTLIIKIWKRWQKNMERLLYSKNTDVYKRQVQYNPSSQGLSAGYFPALSLTEKHFEIFHRVRVDPYSCLLYTSKKGLIVMFSIALSMVVVNCIVMLVQGYDFESYRKDVYKRQRIP